jgi:hypothetical protein
MIRQYEKELTAGKFFTPTYASVDKCLRLAERDLWETRLRLAKTNLHSVEQLRAALVKLLNIDEWGKKENQLAFNKVDDLCWRWRRAVNAIQKKREIVEGL